MQQLGEKKKRIYIFPEAETIEKKNINRGILINLKHNFSHVVRCHISTQTMARNEKQRKAKPISLYRIFSATTDC